MKHNPSRELRIVVLAVEVAVAVLAWRDLNHRSDDQIRGKKNAWRAFISINPGNSLLYWAFGRR
jgi:hypothetical protein